MNTTQTTPDTYSIMVCTDCYYVHHYGDIGDCPYAEGDPMADHWALRNGECIAAVADLINPSDNTDSETGSGIREFSSQSCDCCDSPLGGARYRLNVEA